MQSGAPYSQDKNSFAWTPLCGEGVITAFSIPVVTKALAKRLSLQTAKIIPGKF